MSNTNKHKNTGVPLDDFFSTAKVNYGKGKEEVWAQIESEIDFEKEITKKRLISNQFVYAMAASILVILGIVSILRFYTTTIECPAGQHITASLPDGSTVELNAESTLSYKPYWWRYSRNVKFNGEGFFKVEKGKKFTVESDIAKTIVLGTSFNIYARNGIYEVVCHTGKVKVVSGNKNEGILSPGYEAKLSLDGEVIIYKSKDAESSISWIDNRFIFTAVPLSRVFGEIERQYNVQISFQSTNNYTYTGYFTKDKPIEEVLELVCKPFGLTFVPNSGNKFVVVQN